MSVAQLVVGGARQHNLKNIHVRLPRNRFVVITGPSGSGKSSLAFDTIFAEGQRRFVESLSVHARRYVELMPKPDVDFIEGLSPAVSAQRGGVSHGMRSTVGTATEIYDYLRLLFARIGQAHCPDCGRPLRARTIEEIVDWVRGLPAGTRVGVHAPVVRGREGSLELELEALRRQGFVRVLVDSELRDLDELGPLAQGVAHDVDVVVDRIVVKPGVRQRLAESVELALGVAEGLVRLVPADAPDVLMTDRLMCTVCGSSLPALSPRSFSFNSPAGACPHCDGLGVSLQFDPELVVPDPGLSLQEGALAPWGRADGPFYTAMLERLRAHVKVDLSLPWHKLRKATRERVLYGGHKAKGSGTFAGVLGELQTRCRQYERRSRADSGSRSVADYLEREFHRYALLKTCSACGGARLCPQALCVKLGGKSIDELASCTLDDFVLFLDSGPFEERQQVVGQRIARELTVRARLLLDLGLGYLSLKRTTSTLSGGEGERVRLATQIGAALVGVTYVLDEPSVGLHPRDQGRLLQVLLRLRDQGNSVLVVEHDLAMIRAADWVIDMGPGAGRNGGRVVACGTPAELCAIEDSLTGLYLAGSRKLDAGGVGAQPDLARVLRIDGATTHNLKRVSVRIPLGVLCCVTGVSGSGKSTLVIDTLLPALRERLQRGGEDRTSAPHDAGLRLQGCEQLDKVVHVDQAAIGRTPRSSPATYVDVLTPLRELYAQLPEARTRGYGPGRFSYNQKGGRCEACHGDGTLRIEMHFLPDVYVCCELCGGRRYNRETLEIRYNGRSIADVLEMSVDAAAELFAAIPKLHERLRALRRVGLGYLALGQSATTLSGGEAQRVKLAREFARRATGRTLYILDEPTTGLHASDIEVLLRVLRELVQAGNSVLVVEHNLQLIRSADYIIDMGPEGGPGGGRVVACGSPRELSHVAESHTGRFLQTA